MKKICVCFFSGVFVLMAVLHVFSSKTYAADNSLGFKDAKESLIFAYEDAVNHHNVDEYISLFAKPIMDEMEDFICLNGQDYFFLEEKYTILDYKEIKDGDAPNYLTAYEDVSTYAVSAEITYGDNAGRITCNLINGENNCIFTFVKENGTWKIYNISSNAVEDDNLNHVRSLACPSETVIYFTKTDNYVHWGAPSYNLMWNDYLKNVIPGEWYVSYFSLYPDYGYTSVLASKMYAWYNTYHPKWYYAPFYACMKDNDDDQNYHYLEYDSLGSYYQGMENSALSAMSNYAIVNSYGNVFLIHYNSLNDVYHSGTLYQPKALTFAQGGQSYDYTIHYYYDQCPNAGYNNVFIVTY